MRPPVFIVIVALILAAICASLGWIALDQQQITTGGKGGIVTSYGLSAVVKGWLFIAGALIFFGILAFGSRFRNIIWLALFIVYAVGVTIYTAFYAPSF